MREDLDIPMPAMSPGGTTAAGYRVPRQRPGIDPNTRRMALIAGGILGAFVLLSGAYALIGSHKGGVPVIEADRRPLREKPANPGGMNVAGRDTALLGATNDAAAKLAPATEAPDPQALQPPPAAAAPTAVATTAQPDAAPPPAPVAAPAPAPVAAPVAMAAPAPLAALPREHGPKLPALPADHPARTASRAEAPAHVAAPVRTAVARPAPAPARPAIAGHAEVQLAAVGSEAAAQAEWKRQAHLMPQLLGGRKPIFSKVEHNGHIFWRIRTGGFADLAAARKFCTEIAAHKGSCLASAS